MSQNPPDLVLAHNRTVLLDALRAASAVSAEISYSGYGDSGNINEIQILATDGSALPGSETVTVMQSKHSCVDGQWETAMVPVELSLRDALDAFADRAIEHYHAGYENGEGGDGEIVFDCSTNTARIDHRDHYIESDHSSTDL